MKFSLIYFSRNFDQIETSRDNSQLDDSIPTTDASFESHAFSTPRKVYAFPISSRASKHKTPRNTSVPCAQLVQLQPIQDLNDSQSDLNEDLSSVLGADLSRETDSETPKNAHAQQQIEYQISTERQMFEELFDQMKSEFKEHRIDQVPRVILTICLI